MCAHRETCVWSMCRGRRTRILLHLLPPAPTRDRGRPASDPGAAARAEAEPMERSAASQLATATRRSLQPPSCPLAERRRARRPTHHSEPLRGSTPGLLGICFLFVTVLRSHGLGTAGSPKTSLSPLVVCSPTSTWHVRSARVRSVPVVVASHAAPGVVGGRPEWRGEWVGEGDADASAGDAQKRASVHACAGSEEPGRVRGRSD